jgi:hypothetical protein
LVDTLLATHACPVSSDRRSLSSTPVRFLGERWFPLGFAAAASRAGPARCLLFLRFAQNIAHIDGAYNARLDQCPALNSVGRFWVTPEGYWS